MPPTCLAQSAQSLCDTRGNAHVVLPDGRCSVHCHPLAIILGILLPYVARGRVRAFLFRGAIAKSYQLRPFGDFFFVSYTVFGQLVVAETLEVRPALKSFSVAAATFSF